ncbi:hypothetical protein [Pseudomonas sp. RC10]
MAQGLRATPNLWEQPELCDGRESGVSAGAFTPDPTPSLPS